MDPAPSLRPHAIAEAANVSRKVLKDCVSIGTLMEEEWAENRLMDFDFWAAGVGALSTSRASLDDRLTSQPEILTVVLGLLSTLTAFVKSCVELASSISTSIDQDIVEIKDQSDDESSTGGEPDPFLPWSDESSSSSAGVEGVQERKSSLQQAKEDTEFILDQLIRVGAAIRASGTISRLRKADANFTVRDYEHLEDDDHTHSPKIDIKDLRALKTHLLVVLFARPSQGHQAPLRLESSFEQLEQRHRQALENLIFANLRRRNQFSYARRRAAKLAEREKTSFSEEMKPKTQENNEMDQEDEPARTHKHLGPDKTHEAPRTLIEDSRSANPQSETLASEGTIDLNGPMILTKSGKSMSRMSVSMEKPGWPLPPKVPPSRQSFQCPCCCQTLPKTERDTSPWKIHLTGDLQPYTCIFPGCFAETRLFISRKAWKAHLRSEHRTSDYWECLACTNAETSEIFQSADDFKEHIQKMHNDAIPESELSGLLEICVRSTPATIESCPLCISQPQEPTLDPEALLDHIADHIHDFSLRSLPWADNSEKTGLAPKSTRSVLSGEYFADDSGHSSEAQKESASPIWDSTNDSRSSRDSEREAEARKPLDLLDTITEKMVMSPFCKRQFLPQDAFSQIFSKRNIVAALPEASSELVDYVYDKARKVFATVILATRNSGEMLVNVIHPFLNKVDDEMLYRESEPQCRFFGHGQCSHLPAFNLLHGPSWNCTTFQAFYNDRWFFNAPVFRTNDPPHTLAPRTILPFLPNGEDGSQAPSGGFSTVTKATIHRQHQDVTTDDSGLVVAVKELHPTIDYAEPRVAWNMKWRALQMTNNLKSDHLNRFIAAIEMGNKYYLILEWADGGSLRSYWRDPTTKPYLSPKFIAAVLKQLHGLADALEKLHNDSDISEERAGVSGNWRHGDLEPENILRFKTSDDPMGLGTLQIADLGLAKHHAEATRDRDGPTTMRYGVRKYEALEAHLEAAKMRAPRSRRYDLWSMGCIMLEFIIWILYGIEGLEGFQNQAEDIGLIEGSGENDFFATAFYKFRNGVFEVNDVAKQWMDKIQTHDPEFKDSKETALSDLLKFVKTRLLIVRSEEDHSEGGIGTHQERRDGNGGSRASASALKKELGDMIERGERHESYLFTGTDRKNVFVPKARKKARKTADSRLTVPNAQALPWDQNPSEDNSFYVETSFDVPQYSHVR